MSTPTAVRSKGGYFTGAGAEAGAGVPKSGCGWGCGRAALFAAGCAAGNGGKRTASGLGCACGVCCCACGGYGCVGNGCGVAGGGDAGRAA